ncbi:hypothetical protein ACFLTZ_05250, partial [Chloroflexota bacterium]
VSTEVKVSGEGLRGSQKITIAYDDSVIDIVSGDVGTDMVGKFSCTVVIPESYAGNHIVVAMDESGNKPEAEFSLEPKITIQPTSVPVNGVVTINGAGFGGRQDIAIIFDGNKVITTPVSLHTNRFGSFHGAFLVPSYAASGTWTVVAGDDSYNAAEAQLTIFTPVIPATIVLEPVTSLTSPGHVGMELTINGAEFLANTRITITYGNEETINVAEAISGTSGNFSSTFNVPSSVAGGKFITATDGTNTVNATFTMESRAPLMPLLLLPQVATTTETRAYFDWEDITDPSGVVYILQVGTDIDFATIALEKEALTLSEYTLTEQERLETMGKRMAFYWRVKAIDGASNESEWTPAGLFYIGSSRISIPSWFIYTLIGFGVLLVGYLGWRVRRRATSY